MKIYPGRGVVEYSILKNPLAVLIHPLVQVSENLPWEGGSRVQYPEESFGSSNPSISTG